MSDRQGLEQKGFGAEAAERLSGQYGTNKKPSWRARSRNNYPVVTAIVSPGTEAPDLESMNPVSVEDKEVSILLAHMVGFTAHQELRERLDRPIAVFDHATDPLLRIIDRYS